MFENYTYEALMEDVLNNAPEGIDTRQGSIFYDAVAGVMLKIAKLYTDLDLVLTSVFLTSATGDYLDARAAEYGITRQAGSAARYLFYYEVSDGADESEVVDACIGSRFFADGLYFIVTQGSDGTLYLLAEDVGTSYNYITSGTAAVPVNTIDGLAAASFGELYEAGTADEDDDSLRERIQNDIAGPAENGNKAHYKAWCESVDGVGKARIFPLWAGPNTVMAVLMSADGTVCSSDVVEAVQEYVDPIDKGYEIEATYAKQGVAEGTYTMGDGLGEGAANLGAHFLALSPEQTVQVYVHELEMTASEPEDIAAAVEEIYDVIAAYFKSIALSDDWSDGLELTGKMLGARILTQVSGMQDYDVIYFNDEEENYTLSAAQIPTLTTLFLWYAVTFDDGATSYEKWTYPNDDGGVTYGRNVVSDEGDRIWKDTKYVKEDGVWVESSDDE